MLNGAHRRDRSGPVLNFKIFHLAITNPMLPTTGTFHSERTLYQAINEGPGARDFFFVVHHHHRNCVEIAVSDMADYRSDETAFFDVALRLNDTFGKS